MKFLNVMFFIFILAMLLTTCTSGCATRPQYYIINNPVPIGLMESTQRDVPMDIITNDIINANHTELNTVVDETHTPIKLKTHMRMIIGVLVGLFLAVVIYYTKEII